MLELIAALVLKDGMRVKVKASHREDAISSEDCDGKESGNRSQITGEGWRVRSSKREIAVDICTFCSRVLTFTYCSTLIWSLLTHDLLDDLSNE